MKGNHVCLDPLIIPALVEMLNCYSPVDGGVSFGDCSRVHQIGVRLQKAVSHLLVYEKVITSSLNGIPIFIKDPYCLER